MIVSARPVLRPWRSLWSSAWCAQVTVVPEVSSINVFSSGRLSGSSTSVPLGGQIPPVKATRAAWIDSLVNSEASKNAQNQATKNITSEAMNRIMP